ncbi:MAG TPA: hypothetical protein VNH21_16860 [Steroidobacteraceae bacterium]|nr:hypothetical protein [Steroidobacteraceae bacterium]
MSDHQPSDGEIEMVRQIYRVAETLPIDTSLMILVAALVLLIRGSGRSTFLWDMVLAGIEEQRQITAEGTATHEAPRRMQ